MMFLPRHDVYCVSITEERDNGKNVKCGITMVLELQLHNLHSIYFVLAVFM